MGNQNNGPITDKTIQLGSNDRFEYTCIEMQGWRENMVSL